MHVTESEVKLAIHGLKHCKIDESSDFASDHIIYACDNVSSYLALLFTMMLLHGMSPTAMLKGTMVPIPKGRWANMTMSDNFRAITLSSILCKLLDMIILIKEEKNLTTSDMQFSFKKDSSTTMCTTMVQETHILFMVVMMFMDYCSMLARLLTG